GVCVESEIVPAGEMAPCSGPTVGGVSDGGAMSTAAACQAAPSPGAHQYAVTRPVAASSPTTCIALHGATKASMVAGSSRAPPEAALRFVVAQRVPNSGDHHTAVVSPVSSVASRFCAFQVVTNEARWPDRWIGSPSPAAAAERSVSVQCSPKPGAHQMA